MTRMVEDWVGAVTAAAVDVALQALGLEATVRHSDGAVLDAPFGAYVPLTSSDSVMQLGIVAEHADCEAMARALLGMGETEAFGSQGDVSDAIGEIANMVAGGTKTRMIAHVPDIALGLPLCVNGKIEAQGAEQVAIELSLGAARAGIVLLRSLHSPTRPVRAR